MIFNNPWNDLLTPDLQGAGVFFNVFDPKLYLNGELVEIDGHGGVIENLGRAWAEFAKGADGKYATIEDAVKNRQLLAAIARSGKEGRVVDL